MKKPPTAYQSICVLTLLSSAAATAQAPGDPLRLTIRKAVEIALSEDGNLGLQIAAESISGAEAAYREVRANGRPVVDSYISERNSVLNFEAIGIEPDSESFAPLGLSRRVGPFSSFDARLVASYNLLDPSRRRYNSAAQAGVTVAQANRDHTRGTVAFEVARLYSNALWHKERADTAHANLDLSKTLLAFAERQLRAGTAPAIDVARARSQLAEEEYALAVAQSELEVATLEVLDAIGRPLDSAVEFDDSLTVPAAALPPVAQADERAKDLRPDLRAQQNELTQARLDADAIEATRLPTLGLFADYGPLNTGVNSPVFTHTVGFSLRMSVFDGGKRSSRRAAAVSRIRSEELIERQMQAKVALQVRASRRKVELTRAQIEVAQAGAALAADELARARRRHESGVTNSLEVTEAQNRLRRAQTQSTEARYQHIRAWIDFAESQGDIELLTDPIE